MKRADHSAIQVWIAPGVVWLMLLMLLAVTVGSAYVQLGVFNSLINLSVAAAKVALVVLFFMQIKSSSPLLRLASLAGLFWLIFMFLLTAGDYLTRQ